MEKYEMVATTLTGLEPVLARELQDMGGERVQTMRRAVRFVGDDALLYRANMALRTALRVLVPVDEFTAEHEDDLYHAIRRFPWEDIFSVNQTFVIDAVASGTYFRHSQYVALKTKDAIADRFRHFSGKRPSVDLKQPDIYLHVRVFDRKVTVSIDASGVSLDKRGYRKVANEAPINEVLAAGVLLMTGWNPKQPLLDPMSGSGTFSIEAALLGTGTAPGLLRSFAFEKWHSFDTNLFEKIRFELTKQQREGELQIYARDLLSKNIDMISQNAVAAEMEDYLSIKKEDFFEAVPKAGGGVLVMNPPYGERLKSADIEAFYSRIGDTLKQRYDGFDAWLISADIAALKAVGLKATERFELMNGGLPARLLKFEVYRGSRRP